MAAGTVALVAAAMHAPPSLRRLLPGDLWPALLGTASPGLGHSPAFRVEAALLLVALLGGAVITTALVLSAPTRLVLPAVLATAALLVAGAAVGEVLVLREERNVLLDRFASAVAWPAAQRGAEIRGLHASVWRLVVPVIGIALATRSELSAPWRWIMGAGAAMLWALADGMTVAGPGIALQGHAEASLGSVAAWIRRSHSGDRTARYALAALAVLTTLVLLAARPAEDPEAATPDSPRAPGGRRAFLGGAALFVLGALAFAGARARGWDGANSGYPFRELTHVCPMGLEGDVPLLTMRALRRLWRDDAMSRRPGSMHDLSVVVTASGHVTRNQWPEGRALEVAPGRALPWIPVAAAATVPLGQVRPALELTAHAGTVHLVIREPVTPWQSRTLGALSRPTCSVMTADAAHPAFALPDDTPWGVVAARALDLEPAEGTP